MAKILIGGMSCQHCVKSVTQALEGLEGVSNVEVDLLANQACFEAAPGLDMADVEKTVTAIGFEYKGEV